MAFCLQLQLGIDWSFRWPWPPVRLACSKLLSSSLVHGCRILLYNEHPGNVAHWHAYASTVAFGTGLDSQWPVHYLSEAVLCMQVGCLSWFKSSAYFTAASWIQVFCSLVICSLVWGSAFSRLQLNSLLIWSVSIKRHATVVALYNGEEATPWFRYQAKG